MPPPAEKTTCPWCGARYSHVETVREPILEDDAVHTLRYRRCLACRGPYATMSVERVIGRYTVLSSTRA